MGLQAFPALRVEKGLSREVRGRCGTASLSSTEAASSQETALTLALLPRTLSGSALQPPSTN